jgi:tripartite-type tricarboxylate transporter receptor subunit TctC
LANTVANGAACDLRLPKIRKGNTMILPRRQFLQLSTAAIAATAGSRLAWAQTYPTKPVRIIVGFPPGGLTDVVARLIGQPLSERLGQQFIVENRPGAATNVATEEVVHAAADGYTLLMATATNAINASVYDRLNFNFIRDIAPVAGILEAALVMEVSPSFPAKTVPELIAYAKANPGKINYASAGIGSPNHVAGELFKMLAGVDMVHVPYRGSTAGALTDLINGRVQVIFDPVLSSVEHIRVGTLRALAVSTVEPSDALPGVPTVGEFLPGFAVSAWHGLGAPRGTAPEIIDRLNKEVGAALADPNLRARFADLGTTALPPSSPADFGRFIAEDTERWAKVVKFAGIKAE